MANLSRLEVPALLKLRDEVESRLASMGKTLSAQLASLGVGTGPAKRGRKPGSGKRVHALKGTKRPAKFRDPVTGKNWAGVGMTPLWLKRYEADGKSRDQFATGAVGKVNSAKRRRKPAKGGKAARK